MSVSLYLVVYLRKNPLQRKYLFAKKFFPFDVIPQAFYSFPCNPLFIKRLVLKNIWSSRKQFWKCSLFVIISGLVVISKREMDGGRYTQKQGMDCGFPVDVYVYLPHKCKHIMQDYWDSCVVTGYYTTSGRNWNRTTIITSIQICKIPRGNLIPFIQINCCKSENFGTSLDLYKYLSEWNSVASTNRALKLIRLFHVLFIYNCNGLKGMK